MRRIDTEEAEDAVPEQQTEVLATAPKKRPGRAKKQQLNPEEFGAMGGGDSFVTTTTAVSKRQKTTPTKGEPMVVVEQALK